MKFLLLTVIALMFQAAQAGADTVNLKCQVNVGRKLIEVLYTAETSKMELTKSGNDWFGNSYEGNLIMKVDGKEILNTMAEGVGEEYGVIIRGDDLIYANLYVYDDSGKHSAEEAFSVVFGKSFDDKTPVYSTDSKRKDIGGGRKFRKSYAASCKSF